MKGEVWNFRNELLSYCKSDVQLMKEGCLKFAEDTKRDAGFNPLLQCITIASTCHYFWRNHQMQPKAIAVEPLRGWRGLKTSQSSPTVTFTINKMSRGAYKYLHLCFLSMDCDVITNIFSHVGLVKL